MATIQSNCLLIFLSFHSGVLAFLYSSVRPLGVARALWRSASHSVSCFCLEVDGPGKMKIYQGAALKSKPEILDIHLFFFLMRPSKSLPLNNGDKPKERLYGRQWGEWGRLKLEVKAGSSYRPIFILCMTLVDLFDFFSLFLLNWINKTRIPFF